MSAAEKRPADERLPQLPQGSTCPNHMCLSCLPTLGMQGAQQQRAGSGSPNTFSPAVRDGTCSGANSWQRRGGAGGGIAAGGGGDVGHAAFCARHEHRHGRRRGTEPRLSVSGARRGGTIAYLVSCPIPHSPWCTLACSCPASHVHRGQCALPLPSKHPTGALEASSLLDPCMTCMCETG